MKEALALCVCGCVEHYSWRSIGSMRWCVECYVLLMTGSIYGHIWSSIAIVCDGGVGVTEALTRKVVVVWRCWMC